MTAEFGMGSGLIALLRATRPARNGMKQNGEEGQSAVGIRQSGESRPDCLLPTADCPFPDWSFGAAPAARLGK